MIVLPFFPLREVGRNIFPPFPLRDDWSSLLPLERSGEYSSSLPPFLLREDRSSPSSL